MAFDLDEEELEATKKLNRVDKQNEIEDIIKKLKKVVKESRIEFEDFGSLLVAYADLDLIEEMANQLELFYDGELYTAKQLKNIEKNQNKYFVNKKKIRDRINELKELAEKDINWQDEIYYTIGELEKLLEENKCG